MSKKFKSLILISIFIFGFFLRFWGLSSVYMRIDDVTVAKTILEVYNGYWIADPIFFYPPLLYYICAIVLRGISLFLSIIFFHKDPGLYQFTLSQALFISRLVSAFFGFLTIPILYLSIKKLYSEKVAMIGTFLFSISFIHIIHSHQLVMDVLSTFFVVLCFYFCVLIFRSGRNIHYILAGLFAGLSVASKYNGIVSVFIIITAHLLRERGKLISAIFNYKLILSGISSFLGFFIGHPYSIIRFKAFLHSTKFFFDVVHKTEWYLVPIKPEGIIENIKYSKYFQAISNIFSAEGILFFLLIVMGIVVILKVRKKENLLFFSFPFLYFLLIIPALGFSRWRDLTFFSPFYSVIPAIAISSVFERIKKRTIIKIVIPILFVVFAVSTFNVISKSYTIWDDDSSQVLYRWLLRNVEEGKFIGSEWFTIPLEDGKTPFRLHTTPYIFKRNFPSFESFDLLLSSSLCYSHFYKNKKFYSYELSFYKRLERHELVKEFFLKEIEYKNPTIKLYNGKNMRKKELEVLIPQVPYNKKLPREFEILDGSLYGKETKGFFLNRGEKIERIFISRRPVDKFYIFFLGPESDGIVEIKNFIDSKKIKLKKGKDFFYILKPSLSFPFTKYRYSIRIKASGALKRTFVRIVYDEGEAGLQFLEIGDLENAFKCFSNLKRKTPEIMLYMKKLKKGEINIPENEADLLKKLYTTKERDEWFRHFRRITGLAPEFLEETKTIKLQAEETEWKGGSLAESLEFSEGKGIFLKQGENVRISFPEIFLYRGVYSIKPFFIFFSAPEEMRFSIVVSWNGNQKEFKISTHNLEISKGKGNAEIKLEIEKSCPVKITLLVENGENSIIDCLKVSPSFQDVFLKRSKDFKEFMKL